MQLKQLSANGSSRSVSYSGMNKIVTATKEGVKKTFVTYQDSDYKNYVVCYNHNTRKWGIPISVIQGVDNHGSLAIAIDKNYYLHVVGGNHTNAGSTRYRKSLNPFDETAWGAEEVVDSTDSTYANIAVFDEVVHLIYRGGKIGDAYIENKVVYRTKPINGGVWSSPLALADGEGTHLTAYGIGMGISKSGKIGVSFNWYNKSSQKVDANTYLEKLPGESVWRYADGAQITLPLKFISSQKVMNGINLLSTHPVFNGEMPIYTISEHPTISYVVKYDNGWKIRKMDEYSFINCGAYIEGANSDALLGYVNNTLYLFKSTDKFVTYTKEIVANIGTNINSENASIECFNGYNTVDDVRIVYMSFATPSIAPTVVRYKDYDLDISSFMKVFINSSLTQVPLYKGRDVNCLNVEVSNKTVHLKMIDPAGENASPVRVAFKGIKSFTKF